MTKETIMNTYAIEQGYESLEDLYIQSDMIFRHFYNVSDLIQEELKKKCAEEGRLSRIKKEILNTEIL